MYMPDYWEEWDKIDKLYDNVLDDLLAEAMEDDNAEEFINLLASKQERLYNGEEF